MIEQLAVVILAAHLLAVNVASAAPLVCGWLDWREGRGDVVAGLVGRRLLWWAIAALVLGTVAGALLGWALWDDGYRLALHRLRSKIYYGLAELAFSLTLMLLHAWCWKRGWGDGRRGRLGRGGLALLASSNLLYHFPLLLVVFARIVSGLDLGDDVLTAADFRERIADPVVLARSLHFWLASLAVAGAAMMVVADRERESQANSPHDGQLDGRHLVVWGARLALVPSLLQVLSGGWLLVELEPLVQQRLLGGSAVASFTLAAGVAAALWLMHRLASIAMGSTSRGAVRATVAALALVVLLMSSTLRHIERPHRPARPPAESSRTEPGVARVHDYPAL